MQTRRMPAASTTAVLAVVCGLGSACGDTGGETGGGVDFPGAPLAIQPQPIPDADFAELVAMDSLTATATATGIDLQGLVASQAPSPGAGVAGPLALLDMTSFGAVITTTSQASGAFTFHVPGAALGDHLFVFFPDVDNLPGIDVVATAKATASAPCLAFAGAASLLLPTVAIGSTASVTAAFSSTCTAPIQVDRLVFVGDHVLTPPAVDFTIAANGNSPSETFVAHPTTATYQTFLIVASGADRHVISFTGTAH